MSRLEELLAAAREWLAADPDPETRAELEALLARQDEKALEDRFGTRLEFGTAGLRGELGAGPNRMNRVSVAQAAIGLGRYLLAAAERPSVVIGYDGRKNSAVFARDSAELLAGLGLRVSLFDSMVPTPVLAFAGKRLGADAAVMVTASHNPPRDNGYKVYLGGANGGSQLVSPADAEIAREIASVGLGGFVRSDDFSLLGEELLAEYRGACEALVVAGERRELKIVYTALHGVGWPVLSRLFEEAGIGRLFSVLEQQEPDGDFPTVSFPNPEEPGAMDLALELAERLDADLIIANDPDADRLAVALPVTEGGGKRWRMLTGDQLGILLGDEIASRSRGIGKLANSIVSSPLLARVAKHHGLGFSQTLTGFKWISKVPGLSFGYEEALGYCVNPAAVPDKDGVSAALVVADLATRLAVRGQSLADRISELDVRYGDLATGQVSVRLASVAAVKVLLAELQANPPARLGGEQVAVGPLTKLHPEASGLLMEFDDQSRVIIRASGTEAKLKCYLQANGTSAEPASERLESLRSAVSELLAREQSE